ncbi:ATP-binding protein [Aquimarina sp. 2304DJ70-9]|uniref:ATP-binding protein n=1 Tax=Aquimarina penaris TaxID=3231044 RepID=UPI003461BA85
MKLWHFNSSFYVILGVIFLYNIFSGFSQEQAKINPSQHSLDSIAKYYALSNKDSLYLTERLYYISSFLDAAVSYQQDSLVYKGLLQKTWLLGKAKQLDSAIVYTHRLYDIARLNKDTVYIRKALKKLEFYYKKNNQLANAFQYYNEDFRISRILKDTIRAGRSLLQMANIQDMLGDYSGSKTTAIDGLRYIENSSDLLSLAGLYHIISVAHRQQKNYKEAFRYNKLVLTLNKDSISRNKIGDKNILIFKNTKANILADLKNYKEAIMIFSMLLSDSVIKKNKQEYARVLGNLGFVKWLQNKENKDSEGILLNSLKISTEISNTEGLIASNIYLTKYYFEKDKTKALQYAEATYKNAKEQRNLALILESLGFVFQLKDNTNEEAKVFNDIYLKLSEINQSNREIYAVTKYENNKLTNENLILKAETAKKDRQKIIYLFGTIILLLAGGLIFYLLQQRHKREKIRDVFNAETRISKKIHDELANDVYHVMNTIQNKTNDHEVLDKLEDIYSRTRDISRENSSFDTGENYAQELGGMLSSYSSYDTKIIIKDIDDINWRVIKPEKKIVIHRVIQELMINMKKHSQANLVAITFKKRGKNIEISYADNGVGVVKKDIIYSNGLQNAENRIKTIGGSFIFDSEKGKGFKAKINFPS